MVGLTLHLGRSATNHQGIVSEFHIVVTVGSTDTPARSLRLSLCSAREKSLQCNKTVDFFLRSSICVNSMCGLMLCVVWSNTVSGLMLCVV